MFPWKLSRVQGIMFNCLGFLPNVAKSGEVFSRWDIDFPGSPGPEVLR